MSQSSIPPTPPLLTPSSFKPLKTPKFNVVQVPSSKKPVPPPPPIVSSSTTSKIAVVKESSNFANFADELKSKVKKDVEQFKVVPYKINEKSISENSEEKRRIVRFVVTSDTHNKHEMLNLPSDADVLLHCGDFTKAGSDRECIQFNNWLGTVQCKHRIVICGNHEKFKIKEKYETILSNATAFLMDSSVCVEGIKIYGTPFVPNMGDFQGESCFTKFLDNTGFYKKEEDLECIYDRIDDDTDILLTHTPPNKILDGSGKYGSYALMNRLPQLTNLKVSCFGHVHGAYGYQKVGSTLFVNASSDGIEQPIVFDYVINSSE